MAVRQYDPSVGRQFRHADMIRGRPWKHRNGLFRYPQRRSKVNPHDDRWYRRENRNRVCRAGVPFWRALFQTQTHHVWYRCGICDAKFSYWTRLARHWAETPCGECPAAAREGHEHDGDLMPLCNFHHWLFEHLFAVLMWWRRACRRKAPNRWAWSWTFVWTFRAGYLGVPATVAWFLFAR